MSLAGKRILLGVTGSIAAYKAVELLRLMTKAGAHVQVVMTEAATKFVAPLTFETLSREAVLLDMWSLAYSHRIGHIEATQKADLFLIAPATAQTIARLVLGLADDFLSSIYLASRCPVLVAPAMDSDMFAHLALQENLARLRARGVQILEPDMGPLASGLVGRGRLAELPAIMAAVENALLRCQDLAGRVVLVTAGPTREPLDPVRFLSNRSSGKMGYAIAEAAATRGARVLLVSGPTALPCPPGVDIIQVESADEMYRAVLAKLPIAEVVIKAAAVADYRPVTRADHKIKKSAAVPEIVLEPTPDILAEIGKQKGHRVLVGFAAETEDLVANARAKLERKRLDLIVANDVSRVDSGFDADQNLVKILDAEGKVEELPLLTKREVADRILDRVAALLRDRT
ncbi:MAG TPA: bifunctional phosphopantothenoylcysteine decarboxylase/phosphopantothenate--cysteine ligase CoaBC [Candidatus Baltobacteraceae bacterium]|nr:bifunctional phosphopantothenoylcysteine decarboxylase/phosphopantothenate--cysteine ligase CoaBC [Candidatus Baltobacteraceae bacterium]